MPSTITTYLSAISFYYKLQDVPDPTSTFVCEKFLCGLKKFSAPSNQLQPVTIHILNALLMANHSHNPSSYTQVLLASVMTLMYFGCLRIGEVAISWHADHVLHKSQIKFLTAGHNSAKAITINFKSYKHSKSSCPLLTITKLPGAAHCPVLALIQYLNMRPNTSQNALFVDDKGDTITRSWFVKNLKQLLAITPFSHCNINSHSFRIGRTTDMALSGKYSDAYIQQVGRWPSFPAPP